MTADCGVHSSCHDASRRPAHETCRVRSACAVRAVNEAAVSEANNFAKFSELSIGLEQ